MDAFERERIPPGDLHLCAELAPCGRVGALGPRRICAAPLNSKGDGRVAARRAKAGEKEDKEEGELPGVDG